MFKTKHKTIRKGVTKLGATKLGVKTLGTVKFGKTKLQLKGAKVEAIHSVPKPNGTVRIVRISLQDAEINRTELRRRAAELPEAQRASLAAARARAEARLRRPDMSADAVRTRERAGAEWEVRNGPVTAFAGIRRVR